MQSAFIERYGRVFGGPSAAMMRMAGLTEAEVGADGARLVDAAGKSWLDFGSFGIHLLGHRHPRVLEAARRQMETLGLSSKILANAPSVLLGERLGRLAFGEAESGALLANSGSEANEMAIKMARLATGRSRFVALEGAYHGRTDGALRLSAQYAQYFGQSASEMTRFVPRGDAATMEAALAPGDVAAVFVEPVQGEGGIHALLPEDLSTLRTLCDRYGTLLVSDEIQSGLGRSGVLIGCPQADIVTLGKTLAGGLIPVAAAVFRADVFGARARDPVVNASSYAGSALASAVGNAVLDEVTEPGFLPALNAAGNDFSRRLTSRLDGREGLRDLRGCGLMYGLEFDSPLQAGQVILDAARQGLLLSFCLSNPHVVRLYPPAVATAEDIDRALDALDEATRAPTRRRA